MFKKIALLARYRPDRLIGYILLVVLALVAIITPIVLLTKSSGFDADYLLYPKPWPNVGHWCHGKK